MRLSADRLEVIAGERLHAVAIVHTPAATLLAAGGVEHLRHTLEDVGFQDVLMFGQPPRGWKRGTTLPNVMEGLEWLVWLEGRPTQTASLNRTLTEDLRIVNAWDAREDEENEPARMPVHPYAVIWFECACFAGAVRAFGFAYPMRGIASC